VVHAQSRATKRSAARACMAANSKPTRYPLPTQRQPVLVWCRSGGSAEHSREVALVGKTAGHGDVCERLRSSEQCDGVADLSAGIPGLRPTAGREDVRAMIGIDVAPALKPAIPSDEAAGWRAGATSDCAKSTYWFA